MSQVADRVCTKCFDEPTLMVDKPCRRCHFTRGFGWSNWRPRITQSAARALLALCKSLVAEHRIFHKGDGWWCPFCGNEAGSATDFPHTADCPVVGARATIAEAEGQPDAA